MTRLGFHIGQQDTEIGELRKLWRRLDEAGLDRITVWDHFYESPPRDGNGRSYEPLTMLTALAMDTQRAEVGCFVFNVAYRNPAILAKALTTVDHLSNGRVIGALGAGWHIPEHKGFGVDFPEPKVRLDKLSEAFRIVRLMTSQERSSFEGQHYRIEDAANVPQPMRQPFPIAIGGGGEQRTMAIAARRADEWNGGYQSPDSYRHKIGVLNQWCEKFERDPASIHRSIILHFYMSSAGNVPERQRDGAIWGEPQQVIDRIGEYVDAGAETISFALRPPVDWDAVESFIEDVKPAFA